MVAVWAVCALLMTAEPPSSAGAAAEHDEVHPENVDANPAEGARSLADPEAPDPQGTEPAGTEPAGTEPAGTEPEPSATPPDEEELGRPPAGMRPPLLEGAAPEEAAPGVAEELAPASPTTTSAPAIDPLAVTTSFAAGGLVSAATYALGATLVGLGFLSATCFYLPCFGVVPFALLAVWAAAALGLPSLQAYAMTTSWELTGGGPTSFLLSALAAYASCTLLGAVGAAAALAGLIAGALGTSAYSTANGGRVLRTELIIAGLVAIPAATFAVASAAQPVLPLVVTVLASDPPAAAAPTTLGAHLHPSPRRERAPPSSRTVMAF